MEDFHFCSCILARVNRNRTYQGWDLHPTADLKSVSPTRTKPLSYKQFYAFFVNIDPEGQMIPFLTVKNNRQLHRAVDMEFFPLEIVDIFLGDKLSFQDVEENRRKLQIGTFLNDDQVQHAILQGSFVQNVAEARNLLPSCEGEHQSPELVQIAIDAYCQVEGLEGCELGSSLEIVGELLDVLLCMGRSIVSRRHEIPAGTTAEEKVLVIDSAYVSQDGLPHQRNHGCLPDILGKAETVGPIVAGSGRQDADRQMDVAVQQEADDRIDAPVASGNQNPLEIPLFQQREKIALAANVETEGRQKYTVLLVDG